MRRARCGGRARPTAERCGGRCAPRRRRPTARCGARFAVAERAARGRPPRAGRRPRRGAGRDVRAAPTPSRWTRPAAATPPPRARGCCCATSAPPRASRARAPTPPGAVAQLASGKLAPRAARLAVAKDLLDAYQARQRELLKDADAAREKGFATGEAEAAAQAAGYWEILAARYSRTAARPPRTPPAPPSRELRDAAETGDKQAAANARGEIDQALDGFTAAPFTAEESARRAQQLLRFVALVPVEYGRGVKDGRVTLDFEVQEAIAFATAADAAFDDLRDQLAKRDAAATDAVGVEIDRLAAVATDAARKKTGVTSHDDVEKLGTKIEDQLADVMPETWQKPTDDSDYDLIALTLDRMEAAVGAGQRRQAEQARLEAYAFFEFGPERRLKSIDPGLATDIEGLIWFGAMDHDGLAELISKGASRREVHETRLALDERARGRARDARRQRQPHHGGHQRRDHRLPRGPRGRADPRRHHRVVRRHPPAPAAPGAGRRRARPGRERVHLGARADAARSRCRSTARSSRRWWG